MSVLFGPVAVMPPQLAWWARTLEISLLSDELAMTARQYLSRFWELLPEVRDSLGQRIGYQVVEVISPPPPPGVAGDPAVGGARRTPAPRGGAARRAPRPPHAPPRPPAWGPGPAPVPMMAVAYPPMTGPYRPAPQAPPSFSAPPRATRSSCHLRTTARARTSRF